MTALGGDELTRTWTELASRLGRPQAILMVSAHWGTRLPIVTGSTKPETLHDFGGFPASSITALSGAGRPGAGPAHQAAID